jgi:hypothetical protein
MQPARQEKMSIEKRVGLSEVFENVFHQSGRKRDYAKNFPMCDAQSFTRYSKYS